MLHLSSREKRKMGQRWGWHESTSMLPSHLSAFPSCRPSAHSWVTCSEQDCAHAGVQGSGAI